MELRLFHELLHSEDPPVLFYKLSKDEWRAYDDAKNKGLPTAHLLPPLLAPSVPPPTVLSGLASGQVAVDLPAPFVPSHAPASNLGMPTPAPMSNQAVVTSPARSSLDVPTSTSTRTTDMDLPEFVEGSSTSMAPPPVVPGGFVLSFGKDSAAVAVPKPRAVRRDAGVSLAEKARMKAQMAAEEQAKKTRGKRKGKGKGKGKGSAVVNNDSI